ncbi:TrmB family transcriptional regulator [Bacillus massiliigorillae]|uniref:TrmB family transcriptional regulator n=1 Tax=Bacillus massiliigorillae TaxID=1243664 RepID=UPI00039C239D|nr:TrmB family transcriptional regulator [Bacillus massiliigorillae]
MDTHDVVIVLKDYGFSEYEAKVYVSLLQEFPLNGNAIAVKSGVPGPKVYETLRRMQEKGVVYVVKSDDSSNAKRYAPLPYQTLLEKMEQSFSQNMSLLSLHFQNMQSNSNNDWTELFHVEGYEISIEVIKSEIKEASNEIIISCWGQELELLHKELKIAYEKGVNVVTITFSPYDHPVPWRNFNHYEIQTVDKSHKGELSCVIDQKKAIIFESVNQQPHAIVSSHHVMVKITRNYIRHDIYVNRLVHDFIVPIKEKYGEDLEWLINDF